MRALIESAFGGTEESMREEGLARFGFDLTSDSRRMLDMAAVTLTLACWRNTVIEDIHAGRAGASSIPDHDMLKLGVEVYRDVREAIDVDEIDWVHVRQAVTHPFRRLSDGRTFREVCDSHDWVWVMDRLGQAVRECEEIAGQVGTEYFVLACALDADAEGAYWWGQPWFPLVVADFFDRLDDPTSGLGAYLAGHPERRTPPMDRASLFIGLLEAPDRLPADARTWLTDLAFGYPRTDVIARYAEWRRIPDATESEAWPLARTAGR